MSKRNIFPVAFFLASLGLLGAAGAHAQQEQPAISGVGHIKWASAKWADQVKNPVLELAFAQDSDWKPAACAEGEYLSVLVVFLRDAGRGDAAKLLTTSTIESKRTAFQSVTESEGLGFFIFAGGDFDPGKSKPSLQGAVMRISHSYQLKPEVIQNSKVLRIEFTPKLYAPTAKLEGKGRLALVLQKNGKDGTKPGLMLSNLADIPVEFPAAKTGE